ncbi:MAG: DUF2339 domain-containing protein, partial [Gammaproteobacteria bacterium]|nr:DUF2339 domain-containing protein [Gammaproteobacteria bacterium]
MGWLLLILGAVIGAILDRESGFVFGGLIGYLLGHNFNLTQKQRQLEKQFCNLAQRVLFESPDDTTTKEEKTQVAAETVTEKSIVEEVIKKSDEEQITIPVAAKVNPSDVSSIKIATGWGEDSSESEWGSRGVEAIEGKLFSSVKNFFLDGNVVVRVGIVVLFFGVAFLLKYASDHSLLSIEWRLSGAALGAVALIAAGWRLRHRRLAYALLIQGGGTGLLYLTVYASAKLYHLIPVGMAFGLMLALVAFSALLALLQNSRSLAVFGISGGFLAPVLTSTGDGSHVMLFSYYALLNGGILGIAWFKAWRELNLLGFLFTFIIGSVWGLQYYRPEHFATTEPFLILFFLFYVAIAILYAVRQPLQLKGYVD